MRGIVIYEMNDIKVKKNNIDYRIEDLFLTEKEILFENENYKIHNSEEYINKKLSFIDGLMILQLYPNEKYYMVIYGDGATKPTIKVHLKDGLITMKDSIHEEGYTIDLDKFDWTKEMWYIAKPIERYDSVCG